MKRTKYLAIGLVALGVLQMNGELLSLCGLRLVGSAVAGFAAATAASPAPKVFSAVRGLETFSTRFALEWTHLDGSVKSVELTPQLYSRMLGPYNRRNVYGAVLAYGPVLASTPRTRTMFEAVMRHALCGDAPLLSELGIDASDRTGVVSVRYLPVSKSKLEDLPDRLEAPCR